MFLLVVLYINILAILSSDIECYDANECESQELTGSVLCYGYQSCQASSITSGYYVPCVGYKSCINSNIISTTTIACDGDYACSNAQLSSSDVLRCHGHSGCYGADIDAAQIKANGAYALNTATIESKDQNHITIYSKGYLSGMNANVICRSGKTCNIFCEGNGCQDLNIGCLEGSQCNVSPSICTPTIMDTDTLKDDADKKEKDANNYRDQHTFICPNWWLSESTKADNILLTRLDGRRLDTVKNMEFTDSNEQNVHKNLLDPIKLMNIDDINGGNGNMDKSLYHSRGFGPRGSNRQDNKNINDNEDNGDINDNVNVNMNANVNENLLFHSRGFGRRGDVHQGKDASDDEPKGNEQILEANAHFDVIGSTEVNSGLDVHIMVILTIICCSILMIGVGAWFCYKRHSKNHSYSYSHSRDDYNLLGQH